MSETKAQIIQEELALVKERAPSIEGVTVIACVEVTVRLAIEVTDQKKVTFLAMFPEKYPDQPIIIELLSKTLSDKLLYGLVRLCEEQAKKYIGEKQILPMVNFVKTFLMENHLCICNDEIATVKKELISEGDELKLKQKASELVLRVNQEKYSMAIKIGVPETYPTKQVQLGITENNFPELLKVNFLAQAVEIARQCVQPPIKKNPKDPPFHPKPSLLPVCKFLITDCIKRYPVQTCPLCKERVLPTDPNSEQTDKRKRVERVYCGHLYHYGCLSKYLKTPPFANGKFCPAPCGKQIFHDKWKVSPQLAEARWAHKQARQRELAEVVDFLE